MKDSKLNFWTKVYFQVTFQCVIMFSDLGDLEKEALIVSFTLLVREFIMITLDPWATWIWSVWAHCRQIVFSKLTELHSLCRAAVGLEHLWTRASPAGPGTNQSLRVPGVAADTPVVWKRMTHIFSSHAFFFLLNLAAGFRKCIIRVFFPQRNNFKWRVKILQWPVGTNNLVVGSERR